MIHRRSINARGANNHIYGSDNDLDDADSDRDRDRDEEQTAINERRVNRESGRACVSASQQSQAAAIPCNGCTCKSLDATRSPENHY
ncbi:MAG: hypothetical protein INR71_15390 [Terriglobus roseus]|nr:hypothetical protein [Terriglobus roseus]